MFWPCRLLHPCSCWPQKAEHVAWHVCVLSLLATARAAYPTKSDLINGHNTCPCISHNPASGNADARWANTIAPHVTTTPSGLEVLLNPDGFYIPRGYGSGECRPHDNETVWCRETRPNDAPGVATGAVSESHEGNQSWCVSSWCYVDPRTCTRPKPSRSLLFEGMYYSYETCGNINSYDQSDSAGATYRAQVQALPKIVIGKPPFGGFVSVRGDAFLNVTLGKLGATDEQKVYRDVSKASKKVHTTSSYTACAHDVALGFVDVCTSLFLDLPVRRSLTPMVRITSYPMFVMGRIDKMEQTFWETLEGPFLPFSWELWGLIALITLVCAITLAFLEYGNQKDFPGLGPFGTGSRSMYLMTKGLLDGGIGHMPQTTGGRLVALSYAFFVLVILVSYEGNTTVFLFRTQSTAKFEDLEDAIFKGIPICSPARLFEPMLFQKYSEIRSLLVYPDELEPKAASVWEAFDRGACGGIIEAEWVLQQEHGSGNACHIQLIGPQIHTFGWGYPVSNDLLPAVSWQMLDLDLGGGFIGVEQEFTPPTTQCPVDDEEEESEEEAQRLKPSHFLGCVMVHATAIVIAFGHRLCEWLSGRRGQPAAEEMQAPPQDDTPPKPYPPTQLPPGPVNFSSEDKAWLQQCVAAAVKKNIDQIQDRPEELQECLFADVVGRKPIIRESL